MAKSRLIGDYPVIGIRPTIDGRRGKIKVRESLEDQTMQMALSAKKLIEENVFYSNGEHVKVIVADTTIGRVAEAAACADKFKKAGVDVTLTVTPCWCYGSETMDMDPLTIKAVWGFNGTERPGAVYLASVLASHAQKGLPAFGIYGKDVMDADNTEIPYDVAEKMLRFMRAAVAAATMRGKSYLQIGSITMGIAGSIIDPDFFEDYLGMRVESVDEVEIIRRMNEKIYDKKEYEKALKWVKENCRPDFDKNPAELQKTPAQKEKDWEFTVKMCMIIKDLFNGNKALQKKLHRRIGRTQRHRRRFPGSTPVDGLLSELRLPRKYFKLHFRLERRARTLRFSDRKRHLERRFDAVQQTSDGARANLCGRKNLLVGGLR